MAILELSIPPHFFDSAKEENHFESVSERIAKSFLTDILNINDIKRGNPDLQEPDYIFGKHGYEVTFAIKQSLIPQLKGVRKLDDTPQNIEESLIADITEAVNRKASKDYSCIPSLVIIAISSLPTWYSPLFFKETDPICKMIWNVAAAKRDKLFHEIYQNYICTGKLENIYIIQPTFNGTFAFYDIAEFENNKENFLTHVQSNNPKAFPSYKVVDAEKLTDVTSFKIKILNYVFEE